MLKIAANPTSLCRDSERYADGLGDEGLSLIAPPAVIPNRGFAFAQEDHGSRTSGTFVDRRTLIRMFNTLKTSVTGREEEYV